MFQTYCGKEFGGNVYAVTVATEHSFEDCMNQCTINRPLCYGLLFAQHDNTCYMLGGTPNASNLTSNPDNFIAIPHSSQLQAQSNTACPYTDTSYQTTQSGEQFLILCDKDFGGFGDYCPYSEGRFRCPAHTDSLEQCMELCSHAHPLCKGVSWNPDLIAGYANCYFKNDPQGGTAAADVGFVTHSAEVTPALLANVNVNCPGNKSYATENGKFFNIDCYDGRVGSDNITSHHEYGVHGCIESCSTQTGQGCIGWFSTFRWTTDMITAIS